LRKRKREREKKEGEIKKANEAGIVDFIVVASQCRKKRV
jgi:hypothetical protein